MLEHEGKLVLGVKVSLPLSEILLLLRVEVPLQHCKPLLR